MSVYVCFCWVQSFTTAIFLKRAAVMGVLYFGMTSLQGRPPLPADKLQDAVAKFVAVSKPGACPWHVMRHKVRES